MQGVPVTDRGFRYGMSVFESFPIRNGVPLFLSQHLSRLRAACAATGLTAPPDALAQCEPLLRQTGDGFARVYVTAGDGSVTDDCHSPRVLVFVEARDPIPASVYHRGYDLGFHATTHTPTFPGLKTGNYWPNLNALRAGVTAHHHETLLFTPAGHLVSASMANIFVIIAGRIQTPDLSTGARPGVVREWVMRRADVTETLLTRAAVESADELFLTNSWFGIMPAASLESRPLRRIVGPGLLEAYRKEIETP